VGEVKAEKIARIHRLLTHINILTYVDILWS
jgi:hypothetical protein